MARLSRHQARVVAVLLLAAGAVACHKTQVVQGACRSVNGADVCVWHEMSGSTLVAFGATVPIRAIDSAPADRPMVWPPVADAEIPLPDAVKAATGFDNLTVFWEAHGHPPGPFSTPHFDFHFNTATPAELQAMDCADSTKPGTSPAGYELPDIPVPQLGTLVGLCVPHMGMHALPSADANRTAPFEQAMVVGYYGGRPIFLEPMVSSEALRKRRGFDLQIPGVSPLPAGVRHPARFRADYDSTAQAYRFVFSGLTGSVGS